MISGHDIVCLSSQDWRDLWTRKQRFMHRFARQGNRVLYVETELSLASLPALREDPARAWRWRRGPRLVEPNLHVATLPLVWPFFQMSVAINWLNNAGLAPLLRRWIRGLGLCEPILWTYNPYSASLVGRLGEALSVYDCVDDLTAARGLVRRSVVRRLERRLLENVRLVIVTQENLRQGREGPGREVVLIPNGVDVEHFRAASRPDTPVAPDLQAIPRPVVGFVGSVQYWIDFDLLGYLARARPTWSFVLVGPRGRLARVEGLEALPNVHLFGRRPYETLPTYLKGFDVCLNPYVADDVARHASPLKLYEYLASGRPVVSVDMPEARRFADVIRIGRSYPEVLDRLDEALAPGVEDGSRARARIATVSACTWDHRFRDLEAALERHLPARDPAGRPPVGT